jgi:hypothetical protein
MAVPGHFAMAVPGHFAMAVPGHFAMAVPGHFVRNLQNMGGTRATAQPLQVPTAQPFDRPKAVYNISVIFSICSAVNIVGNSI